MGFLVLLCRFNLRSFDLSVGLGAAPSIQSHSPLCIASKITDCYWLEESFLSLVGFSLKIHVIGTETIELRTGPPVQYLNNRSHGQNLRSTPC